MMKLWRKYWFFETVLGFYKVTSKNSQVNHLNPPSEYIALVIEFRDDEELTLGHPRRVNIVKLNPNKNLRDGILKEQTWVACKITILL